MHFFLVLATAVFAHEVAIIGTGLGRTGTTSTLHALNHLGFKSYHMVESLAHNDFDAWRAFLEHGNAQPALKLLKARNYTATLDYPACLLYKELMAEYPSAKVLLNVRDTPQAWCKSINDTIYQTHTFSTRFPWTWVPTTVGLNAVDVKLWQQSLGYEGPRGAMTEGECVTGYEHWIASVRAHVPPERLLVFNAKQGWAPLCALLNLSHAECPTTPFPHVNDTPQMQRLYGAFVFVADYSGVLLALVALVIVVVFQRCAKRLRSPTKAKKN